MVGMETGQVAHTIADVHCSLEPPVRSWSNAGVDGISESGLDGVKDLADILCVGRQVKACWAHIRILPRQKCQNFGY